MASKDELRIKAILDTKQFDSSLEDMKQEFTELEKKLGSSILSERDQKLILARMGTLKKGIDGFNLQIDALSKQTGFNTILQATTPLIGGFTAAASALQLFGVENEKVNEIVQQTQALTIGLMALNDLSNLQQLKGLAMIKAEKIKNYIVDKVTFKNTVRQGVANAGLAASQGKVSIASKIATKAQWLWNAAITANPIVALIVGIAALVTGIILLAKHLGSSTESFEQQTTAIDGITRFRFRI